MSVLKSKDFLSIADLQADEILSILDAADFCKAQQKAGKVYLPLLGKSLGMGYVTNDKGLAEREFILGASYEIEVAGERVAADASLAPWYDPSSLRVKDAGHDQPRSPQPV